MAESGRADPRFCVFSTQPVEKLLTHSVSLIFKMAAVAILQNGCTLPRAFFKDFSLGVQKF
jgi:hypothetical protein